MGVAVRVEIFCLVFPAGGWVVLGRLPKTDWQGYVVNGY